jgi:hypothetical protein
LRKDSADVTRADLPALTSETMKMIRGSQNKKQELGDKE